MRPIAAAFPKMLLCGTPLITLGPPTTAAGFSVSLTSSILTDGSSAKFKSGKPSDSILLITFSGTLFPAILLPQTDSVMPDVSAVSIFIAFFIKSSGIESVTSNAVNSIRVVFVNLLFINAPALGALSPQPGKGYEFGKIPNNSQAC